MTNTNEKTSKMKQGLAALVLGAGIMLTGCNRKELSPETEERAKEVIIYCGTLDELNSRPEIHGKYEFVPGVYNFAAGSRDGVYSVEERIAKEGYSGIVTASRSEYGRMGTPIRFKKPEERK